MSSVHGAAPRPKVRPIPALSAHPAAAAEQWEMFSKAPLCSTRRATQLGCSVCCKSLFLSGPMSF